MLDSIEWARRRIHERIWHRRLASNLAIGAALCRAYYINNDWKPGCGRPAP